MIKIVQITKEEAKIVRKKIPDERMVFECSKLKKSNGHTYYAVECKKVMNLLKDFSKSKHISERYFEKKQGR